MMESIKRHKKIFAVLSVLLFILFVLLVGLFTSRLEKVNVKSLTYYNEAKFLDLYDIKPGTRNTIISYLKLKYGKRPSIPFIDDLDTDFVDLHTLNVRVYEKHIIGCIEYMGEYVCFDKDGVIVGSITKKRKDIPVVSGINYSSMIYNKKVDTSQDSLFKTVLNITQLIDKYKLSVQEINFDSSMNVTLTCGSIRAELGTGSHFDPQISNLGSILDKARGMKGVLHMQDYVLSGGRVVFEKE